MRRCTDEHLPSKAYVVVTILATPLSLAFAIRPVALRPNLSIGLPFSVFKYLLPFRFLSHDRVDQLRASVALKKNYETCREIATQSCARNRDYVLLLNVTRCLPDN
jgi:hypothetical protein